MASLRARGSWLPGTGPAHPGEEESERLKVQSTPQPAHQPLPHPVITEMTWSARQM